LKNIQESISSKLTEKDLHSEVYVAIGLN